MFHIDHTTSPKIVAILLGKLPLPRFESRSQFDLHLSQHVQKWLPQSLIEWAFVCDIAYYNWILRRLEQRTRFVRELAIPELLKLRRYFKKDAASFKIPDFAVEFLFRSDRARLKKQLTFALGFKNPEKTKPLFDLYNQIDLLSDLIETIEKRRDRAIVELTTLRARRQSK